MKQSDDSRLTAGILAAVTTMVFFAVCLAVPAVSSRISDLGNLNLITYAGSVILFCLTFLLYCRLLSRISFVSSTGKLPQIFAVLFLTLSLIRRRAACALLLGAVSSVFLWLHQAFLRVLASGLYLCALVGTGQIFLGLLDRKRQLAPGHLVTWMASLILGCGLTIFLFCAMSHFGAGGIGNA